MEPPTMASFYTIDRRTFLKLAAAGIAVRTTLGQSGEVYSAGFVPPGADAKIAFVSDHHYWPGNLENWGDGSQITTSTDRRMPDLVEALNDERLDLSIHAGDVISAGDSFFPPPEEYARQLAFAKRLYDGLSHPSMPLPGNHETAEPLYVSEDQLEAWSRNFGAPYRMHDLKGWRIIGVNCLLPHPGGSAFGLDPVQLRWVTSALKDASGRGMKVILCTHVPPGSWVNSADFADVISSAGCVRAILCGHTHRNSLSFLAGVPVLVRVANVTSPFGYTILHLYPDGRIVVVQKSQHFPMEDFISSRFQAGALGGESDRFLTLGGSSQLPLGRLQLAGPNARAAIVDGHLRLASRERATILVDTANLRDARLTLTAVKAGAERTGGLAMAGPDGTGGIEAAVTSRYSPDGKVYLARSSAGTRTVLARSWFNIADNIAYRLTLEVRNGRIKASWKNMLTLETSLDAGESGRFGFFVDRGAVFVTDLRLESL
jgi:hypothetical protein